MKILFELRDHGSEQREGRFECVVRHPHQADEMNVLYDMEQEALEAAQDILAGLTVSPAAIIFSGLGVNAMDTITTFHDTFDLNARELLEPVRDTLLESTQSATRPEIIGQLLMDVIADDGFTGNDPESYFKGQFTLAQRQNFMAIADHMGPDWTQALYHAAAFMTKVA